jgi:hypothetical protein
MHRGRTLGWVAFMILCPPVANVAAAEKKHPNAIKVLEATYGGNCEGVGKGNVTKFVASACDGTDLCNYRVYYKNMGATLRRDAKRPSALPSFAGKIRNQRPAPWRPRRARVARTASQTIFAFCIV